MKKLALLLLAQITLLAAAPMAYAEDLTPTSIALSHDSNSMAERSSLKASIPEVDDGQMARGVDIVSQSLKYHSSVNPEMTPPPGKVRAMPVSMPQQPLVGAVRQNSVNNRMAMPMNQMQYGQIPNQNPMMARNQFNQMMPQYRPPMVPQVSSDTVKKAIGVAGTAALVGVFVKSGGLGGLTRSLGWDNHRYMRGGHR